MLAASKTKQEAGGSLYLSAHSIPRSAFINYINNYESQKRAYESQKRAYESQKRAYEPHKRREKRENVFIIAKILSSVLLASALLRSAPMSLISAGKNGKNVFISVKSSVANWQARL